MDNAIQQAEKPYLVLKPDAGWAALNLAEIWHFRSLLFTLAGRDVKLRYRQTALGVIWVLLQPLLAAGIFSFVFGKVAKLPSDGIPYFLFSYAGLLGWTAFQNTLTKTSTCLIQNSALISKVFFPRLILPFSTVFSTLIDFSVSFIMMLVLMVLYHVMPGVGFLLLPVLFILIVMLAVGLGLFASALMVSYRDVQYVIPVLIQILLYASPVAYGVSAVPARLRIFFLLNPLSGLLEALRWSLLGHGKLLYGYLLYSALFTIVVLVVGAFSFKKMEQRFADVI